jgi:hypothetical protein
MDAVFAIYEPILDSQAGIPVNQSYERVASRVPAIRKFDQEFAVPLCN